MSDLPVINKRRIEYLDLAKALAVFCVVLCHCAEQIYYDNINLYHFFPKFSKLFSAFCFVIGRCGVPFFLFVSGVLLINKRVDTYEDYKMFIKKNFLTLFFATEIWIIIYNIFLFIMDVKEFDFIYLIESMLFLKQLPLMNTWYMPMILGVYLVMPFVAKAVKAFDNNKVLILVVVISVIANMIVPTINSIFESLNMESVTFFISVSFLGGHIGIYLITGYLINKGIFKSIPSLLLLGISVLAFVISSKIHLFILGYSGAFIWYDCIFLYICTLCLFEIFKRINFDKIPNIIRSAIQKISKYSLAIYFMHIIFVMLLGKYVILLKVHSITKFAILYISTIICSLVLIEVLSKIKFVKKMILHIS